MPEGWRPDAVVREARRRGVAVAPPRGFVAGQVTTPGAVRLCPGSARSREELREGLAALRELLEEGPVDGRA